MRRHCPKPSRVCTLAYVCASRSARASINSSTTLVAPPIGAATGQDSSPAGNLDVQPSLLPWAPQPRVLLADEPTGELDESTAAGVLDLLATLKAREGASILTLTHNPQVAERADRAYHHARR